MLKKTKSFLGKNCMSYTCPAVSYAATATYMSSDILSEYQITYTHCSYLCILLSWWNSRRGWNFTASFHNHFSGQLFGFAKAAVAWGWGETIKCNKDFMTVERLQICGNGWSVVFHGTSDPTIEVYALLSIKRSMGICIVLDLKKLLMYAVVQVGKWLREARVMH